MNFIWKYGAVPAERSDAPLKQLASNVFVKGWIEQEAILGIVHFEPHILYFLFAFLPKILLN